MPSFCVMTFWETGVIKHLIMIFEQACQIINNNLHLLGQVYLGQTIDELIIVPTNQQHLQEFEMAYIRLWDAQQAIVPFINEDVEVYAIVGKNLIRQANTLPFIALQALPREFNVQF